KKLIAKRVDLTLEDEIVARVVTAKEDASMLEKIKFTENSFSSADLRISAGLANPRCKEIIEAFNKGLAEIKVNGEFKKIFESYGLKTE
ncbi:MAG: transporter substrate-binding domain-containing protein, partial [Desulfamplus sp.]|nr:transporter substrate-binding domain-containing protein [Desulfamplus sp.]